MSKTTTKKKSTTARGKSTTAARKPHKVAKVILSLLSVVLIGALATSVTFNVLQYKQGKTIDNIITPPDNPVIITPVDTEFMSIMPCALTLSDAEDEYVSRLTATVLPENVDDNVEWTIDFANPSSEWASGKTVTDYATVEPIEDGSLVADVHCAQAFGEQIIVTVASRSNPDAYATCEVDYAVRYTVNFDKTAPMFGRYIDDVYTYGSWIRLATYTEPGTVDDTVRSIEFKVSPLFIERFFANLNNASHEINDFFYRTLRTPHNDNKEIVWSTSKQNGEAGNVILDMQGLVTMYSLYYPDYGYIGSYSDVSNPDFKRENYNDERAFYNLLGIDDELYSSLSIQDKSAINGALRKAFKEEGFPATLTFKIESSYYTGEQYSIKGFIPTYEFPSYISSVEVDTPSIVF